MGLFRIGELVRLVYGDHEPDADDADTVGEVGVVVCGGRYFEDWEAGYDCIVSFPSYPEYCAWNWQLEPATRPGVHAEQRETETA
jgi:hypothetical protein